MSHRIEFQYACIKNTVPNDPEPRFVVLVEGGDNNLTDYRNKVSRSWGVQMIGREAEVLRQAVVFSGSCAGAMVRPFSRTCKAQAYIRRVRRLVQEATQSGVPGVAGWWRPQITSATSHPIVAACASAGLRLPTPSRWFGEERLVIPIDPERDVMAFWEHVSRFAGYSAGGETLLPPWRFGEPYGWPSS